MAAEQPRFSVEDMREREANGPQAALRLNIQVWADSVALQAYYGKGKHAGKRLSLGRRWELPAGRTPEEIVQALVEWAARHPELVLDDGTATE